MSSAVAATRRRGTVDRWIQALDRDAGWLALGAAAVASIALTLYLSRGTTFYLDEITLFSESKGFNLHYLLSPHDGQLILLARLVYSAVFNFFGADYFVIRVVDAAGVAIVGALVYALVRRRVGGTLALAPALIVLFFGTGWEVTLSGNGILNVYCVAAGLGALLALDVGGRYADLIACALLVVSVSSYSFGVAVSFGAAVLILLRPGGWRRAWVFAVPLILYAAWTIAKPSLTEPLSGATGLDLLNIGTFPPFAAESVARVAGAVFGLDYDFSQQHAAVPATTDSWGAVLGVVLIVAAVWQARRRPVSRMVWALIAILVIFWLGITVASGFSRPPSNSRYIYPAAVIGILLAAEIARGIRVSHRVVVVTFAVAVLALAGNIAHLRDASAFLRANADSTRADLAAVEIARDHVSPLFIPGFGVMSDPRLAGSVQAGTYLPAVARNGSFAFTTDELSAASETARGEADDILGQAYSPHVAPATAPRSRRECARVASNDFAIPLHGAVVRAPRGGRLVLRRFADEPTVQAGTLGASRFVAIRIPVDRASERWRGTLAPAQPVEVCPL